MRGCAQLRAVTDMVAWLAANPQNVCAVCRGAYLSHICPPFLLIFEHKQSWSHPQTREIMC